MRFNKRKLKAFFQAFLVTGIALFLVSGLAIADMGTRGVAGYIDGSSLAFSSTNEGLKLTFLDNSFQIPAFNFINGIKDFFGRTIQFANNISLVIDLFNKIIQTLF
jgi:hypothetical protein